MAKKGKLTISRDIIPKKEDLAKEEEKRVEQDKKLDELEIIKTSFYFDKNVWRKFKIHCLEKDIQIETFLNESIDEIMELDNWRKKIITLEPLNADNKLLVVFRITKGKLRNLKMYCQTHEITFRDILESYVIKAIK